MSELYYGVHTLGGVITERDGNLCTIRLRMPAGILSVEKMRGIAEIAERFGQNEVHLTTRQTVEIPHIHYTKLEEIKEALAENGTPLGSEKDEVVNIVACPGTERCKYANSDSISLAKRLDEKLFGKEMPVKIRISISACSYACTSPVLNEIGITTRVMPHRTPGLCTGCGQCTEYCKEGAISVIGGEARVDKDNCLECGVCVTSCPFQLVDIQKKYYIITVGGKRGRHPQMGRVLAEVDNEDDVVNIVDRLVYWVYRRAWSGRLLSDQLEDIKFDSFKSEVLPELLKKE